MIEFEKLYDTYFHDVYRYILALFGDSGLAEEITGETFFKAMHSLDRFRGDCDARVWLCKIAKNCYYTHLRTAGRIRNVAMETLENVPDPGDGPAERLFRQEEADRVRKVLHSLSEPYKEVFLWRVFAQLSFRQIGSLFGKSENWACVTYHRAKQKILKGLEERES